MSSNPTNPAATPFYSRPDCNHMQEREPTFQFIDYDGEVLGMICTQCGKGFSGLEMEKAVPADVIPEMPEILAPFKAQKKRREVAVAAFRNALLGLFDRRRW